MGAGEVLVEVVGPVRRLLCTLLSAGAARKTTHRTTTNGRPSTLTTASVT